MSVLFNNWLYFKQKVRIKRIKTIILFGSKNG